MSQPSEMISANEVAGLENRTFKRLKFLFARQGECAFLSTSHLSVVRAFRWKAISLTPHSVQVFRSESLRCITFGGTAVLADSGGYSVARFDNRVCDEQRRKHHHDNWQCDGQEDETEA